MTSFSVADAKNSLPRLMNRAIDGEDVVITRPRKLVAEIRAVGPIAKTAGTGTHAWLRSRSEARPRSSLSSAEGFDQLYEDHRY